MDGAPHNSTRSSAGWLTLILAIAFGLRVLPVLCHGQYPVLFMDSDSWGYHRLASNLLAGNGYSWDTQPPYMPNLYRPPGFPVILTGIYALTGPSVPAAIVVQAAVSTLTVLLTFFLMRALTGQPGLALVAAATLALDPVAIQYSNLLLTETFTSPLIVLVAWCVWMYRASAQAVWLVAAGVILAGGILVHPVLVFLPAFLLVAPLLSRKTRTPRQFGVAIGTVAIALAPASAWIVRNWYVGDFVGISSVTAVNLLKYKAAGVEAELRGTTREVERDRLTKECEAELPPDATPGERFRLWQRRGSSILLAHPLTYAKVHAKGMALELIGPERDHTTRLLYGRAVLDATGRYSDASTAVARTERRVAVLEAARYLILGWQGLLLLGLATGAWQIARSRPWLLCALMVVPLYVLALSGGPEASPRFRVLYLPVFALLTAVGAQAVMLRCKQTQPPGAWPARYGTVPNREEREVQLRGVPSRAFGSLGPVESGVAVAPAQDM
jgi:4-amino-4-deoxy-L-arabinose transferase-like glycosyltransferase